MPGRLTVFGCLTLPLAADDLSLPALLGVAFRTAALIGAIVLMGIEQSSLTKSDADTLFQALTLALIGVFFVVYVWFYRAAASGQILEWEERTVRTVRIFHLLAVLYILEVALGCYGIALLASETAAVSVTVKVSVIAMFIDIGVLGTILALLLALSRGRRPKPIRSSGDYSEVVRLAMWSLSMLCCKLFGTIESPMGQEELVWSEISRVVHGFLKNMLVDFTVSDIFASFILVWAEQHGNEEKRVEHAFSSVGYSGSPRTDVRFKSQTIPSSPVLASDTQAVEAMMDFERFSPFMMGIYGWKLSMFMRPLTYLAHWPKFAFNRLVYGKHFEEHVHNHEAKIDGVNKLLLYSSWTTYMAEAIPYTICLDHVNKAVVVTTRGTMSVGDIATDLLCTPAKLGEVGKAWGVPDADEHYVHGGMLRVAHRIREDVEKQQILHRLLQVRRESLEETESRHRTLGEELLSDEDRVSFLAAMGRSSKDPLPEGLMYNRQVNVNEHELDAMKTKGYRLIVCGHSLGACMASILSLLLRPRFPQVECLAYSCVSAIFSRRLADESAQWITSVTMGKDIFGRVSWHSAKALRDRMLDVLRRSKTNKQTVLLSLFFHHDMDSLLYPPDRVPDDAFRRDVLDKMKLLQREDADSTLDTVRMFMPGRVLYLEKTHTTILGRRWLGGTRKHSSYAPVWVEDRAALQDVQVSTMLIADHMPGALLRLLTRTGPPPPPLPPREN